jgi:hypothetical protein
MVVSGAGPGADVWIGGKAEKEKARTADRMSDMASPGAVQREAERLRSGKSLRGNGKRGFRRPKTVPAIKNAGPFEIRGEPAIFKVDPANLQVYLADLEV